MWWSQRSLQIWIIWLITFLGIIYPTSNWAAIDSGWKFLIVKGPFTIWIVGVEYLIAFLLNYGISKVSYLFIDYDTDLLDCSKKLVKCDSSFIVNIKKFERPCKEAIFSLSRGTFLWNFRLEVILKAEDMIIVKVYLFMTLFIFYALIDLNINQMCY